MSVTIGSQLGSYEITALLGKGGFGEVYRAKDKKLKREVAIKILPDEFSSNHDRLTRFQREAEVLASLNHPNIAAIYDLAAQDQSQFLVLELVDGETLAERITRGPIPVEEALNIAKQISEALEAAHEKGIIHRDLKPSNIKITPDGKVKVLDFGLAKIHEPTAASSLSDSPTLVTATIPGVILGTAAYMSPEQAKGRDANRASDVWAFGCVLYEMLTGLQTFRGDTVGEVLAEIFKSKPDWSRLPPGTPSDVEKLLKRCLRKDPKQRLKDLGDVRIEIDEALNDPQGIEKSEARSALAITSTGRSRLALAVAAILLFVSGALAVAVAIMWMAKSPDQPVKLRFDVEVASALGNEPSQIALSPDGKHFAAVVPSGKDQSRAKNTILWVRSLEIGTGQMVPGTEDATNPFFSPDGRFIGFSADGKLKKIDILGGPPQTLATAPSDPTAAWASDGTIVFDSDGTLYKVSSSGGVPALLMEPDKSRGELAFELPSFLPDGKHFLVVGFTRKAAGYDPRDIDSAIYVGSLDSPDHKRLLASTSKAIFAPPQHVLFMRENTLMAQALDVRRLELSGDAFPVVEGVATKYNNAAFSVSSNGILAYQAGGAVDYQLTQLTWFDREGKPIGVVGPAADLRSPALSQDAKRVVSDRTVSDRNDPQYGRDDLWLIDERGVDQRLTFDGRINANPIWGSDGRLVFATNRNGPFDLYSKIPNDVHPEVSLYESPKSAAGGAVPTDWSPDGKYIIFSDNSRDNVDLLVLPLFGDRKPFPFLKTDFTERQARFSPDGRWVAYTSDETGRFEVFVQPFPPSGFKSRISTDGGSEPRWRGDGRELYYFSTNAELMSVDISLGAGKLEPGKPRVLFKTPLPASTPVGIVTHYDVTRDGKRFLITAPVYPSLKPAVTVVINWLAKESK